MVLQSNPSLTVGAVAWEFMEFRSRDISAPRIVEEVAIHGDHAVKLLGEVTVLNDNFELVPFPGEFGRAFRGCIDIVQIPCTVFFMKVFYQKMLMKKVL